MMGRFLYRGRTASIRLKIWIAAALISIIPVAAVGALTYSIAESSLMEEVAKTNRATMKHVQERIESMIEDVDRIAVQQLLDDGLQVFLHEGRLTGNEFELSQVMTVLASMETLIDQAEVVYLYMVKPQAVVTAGGVERDPGKVLNEGLLQALHDNGRPVFWHDRVATHVTDVSDSEGAPDGIAWVRRIPAAFEQPLGYFIVTIREEVLLDVFRHMEFGETGGMLFVTSSGHLYADPNARKLLGGNQTDKVRHLLSQNNNGTSGNVSRLELDGRDMLVHGLQSPLNGWQYVSIVPYEELTGHIRNIKRAVLAVCLVLIGIALAASLLLASTLYVKVRALLESMQSRNDKLQRQVQKSLPELRTHFVRKWLTEPLSPEDIKQLEEMGVSVERSGYTAICMEWNDSRRYSDTDAREWLERIIGEAQRMAEGSIRGHLIRIAPDRIAGVFVHESEEQASVRQETIRTAEQLLEQIDRKLGQVVTIGVGETCASAAEVHISFEEGKQAVQHRLAAGGGRVYTLESIRAHSVETIYPLEQEKAVMAGLKLGDAEKAQAALYGFTSDLIGNETLTYDQMLQSYAMLLTAAYQTLSDLGMRTQLSLLPYNGYTKLYGMKSAEEIEIWFKSELFPAVLRRIVAGRKPPEERETQGIAPVLDYIHRHYDQDLSLGLVAERFGLSDMQLSQQFKHEVGLTFTDYMISYRIERAKQMLGETELKVAEIAERVRYNNSQNFIRVFKRVTGLTPGQYRKQNNHFK
ncbi:helix-turn-helix domain-containing protein [Paenibacillus oceani]|uniref:AraC family transcriptional regulator n=1 Tax=Paenibacillus oceani TaxID=2772510 RepID=A0A927H0I0_9BACL|nr:helix-turn-helix domain-containing protein [Paenibacillus oceani]MBD2862504.1 AraC family transcriptional regulator [Paenibacillus oceani]